MVSRSNVAFATNGRLEIMCIVHGYQEFHKWSRKLYDPSFGRIYVRFIQRCWSTKFVYLRNKMRKQKYYNPYVLEQQAEKQVLNLFFLTYGPVENNSIKNNSIKLCRANWSTQFRVLSSRRLIYENKNQTQKYLIFINNVRTYRLSHNNCQHCHIFTSHPALCHETHMNRKYNSFGMKWAIILPNPFIRSWNMAARRWSLKICATGLWKSLPD